MRGTPLKWAINYSRYETAKLLLDAGAAVDNADINGRTPLCFAKTKDLVKMLIKHGADINKQDTRGQTPLHWAAGGSQVGVIETLIEAGADPHRKDKWGRSALDKAIFNKQEDAVKAMKKALEKTRFQ